MAGESELSRVHLRIDDLYKINAQTKEEMTAQISDVKTDVTEIKTILRERPRHEEGKCKPFVEHVEHHDKETCQTLREHIAKESDSTEKKRYFYADTIVRLAIPIVAALSAGGIAWWLHP